MSRSRLSWLILIGVLFCGLGADVHAQFYGGVYGSGFPYGTMPGYGGPPPYGYPPYGMAGAGYGMGYGYNPGFYGTVPPNYVPYGGVGGGAGVANPFVGYPGFGWWPLFASDVKVTAIPVRDPSGQSASVPNGVPTGIQAQPQKTNPVSATVVHTGSDIKLTCPKAVSQPLTYSLNGTVYTIQPGYSQAFHDDRTWKLEFRRSPDAVELTSYTLKPGTYNFAIGTSGWELRQVIKVPVAGLVPAPQPTPSVTRSPETSPGPTPDAYVRRAEN